MPMLTMMLRVPASMHAALVARAEEEGRPVSAVIRQAIQQALDLPREDAAPALERSIPPVATPAQLAELSARLREQEVPLPSLPPLPVQLTS